MILTLDDAIHQSTNEKYDYPDIFNDDAGLQIFEELNAKGIKSWDRLNTGKKRTATFKLKTYKGLDTFAKHFYGNITINGVYAANINDENETVNISYEDEQKFPLICYTYELPIKKYLTKKEKDDNPDKFYGYNVGDLVSGYESITELIEDARSICKLRFTGNWQFIIENVRGYKEEFILT